MSRTRFQPRFGLKTLLAAVAIAAVLIWVGIGIYRLVVGYELAGATADTANYVLSNRVVLPDSAREVNLYADLCWVEIDFALSEADFLAWCQSHERKVDPIDTHALFLPARTSSQERHVVVRGYTFETGHGSGIYDCENRRVCLHYYDC